MADVESASRGTRRLAADGKSGARGIDSAGTVPTAHPDPADHALEQWRFLAVKYFGASQRGRSPHRRGARHPHAFLPRRCGAF